MRTGSERGSLSPEHLRVLREESGISHEVITARGYWTSTDIRELVALGFSKRQLHQPGLLIPLHGTDGTQPFSIYRPDNPRVEKKDGKEKPIKYEIPQGMGVRLDCPPTCRPMLADPSIPLWITEGQKKADALASHGACAVALLGVWNFKGKNLFGGTTLLADFDYIALNGLDVRLVFDSDLTRKAEVRKALERLIEHLQRKGAHVSVVYLPHENGQKCGVDDYLAAGHTLSDLESLIGGPRTQPQVAKPMVELLDSAPSAMRRPLALVDGRAYAAIWPHVKITSTEALDKAGNIIKLNPPKEITEQRLLIVRDDGRIFGDSGNAPLSEIGLTVALEMTPPDDRLWQTKALKVYRTGKRPDVADVFRRVAAVYDHYLDFNRSLAGQGAMSNLSACLSVMTWFTEAFDVLPYPWPNGDWGSGKTKWATLWAKTSYLGQVLTMGGSFAALRDLADYGAALMFDDAEHLDDPKTDPDKRTLLLAGNRRGANIPLMEPTGNGERTWKVRWVNAFCPRGFTAKEKPHGALAPRSLLIPLIKTPDSVRGNRDPVRIEGWPCPWRQLQDDLWATALMLLSEAKRVWAEFDGETVLVGRDLEPWRALLAVARLFERHGVVGLEAEIRDVLTASLEEKIDTPQTYETKVVEAIGVIAFGPLDMWTTLDMLDMSMEVSFTAGDVVRHIKELADEDENTDWANPQRVGLILNTLRVFKGRGPTRKRVRLRNLRKKDVADMIFAYGLSPINMSNTSDHVHMSADPEADRMAAAERTVIQEEVDGGTEAEFMFEGNEL